MGTIEGKTKHNGNVMATEWGYNGDVVDLIPMWITKKHHIDSTMWTIPNTVRR